MIPACTTPLLITSVSKPRPLVKHLVRCSTRANHAYGPCGGDDGIMTTNPNEMWSSHPYPGSPCESSAKRFSPRS